MSEQPPETLQHSKTSIYLRKTTVFDTKLTKTHSKNAILWNDVAKTLRGLIAEGLRKDEMLAGARVAQAPLKYSK